MYQYTTGVTGTASNLLPPQCALAISMRAPIIGRRGRGRIYLPAVSAGVIAADATISATPASNIRTAMATLIANLEDTPGAISLVPCVAVMSQHQAIPMMPSLAKLRIMPRQGVDPRSHGSDDGAGWGIDVHA